MTSFTGVATTDLVTQDQLKAAIAGVGGGAFTAFYVVANGFSGATPTGYTLVRQNSSNIATVNMQPGYNIVAVATGGVGTVNLVKNAQPLVSEVVDADGMLSSVTINRT